MRYRLTIAYDGTSYAGWQVQPNATAIQESIENALKTILKEDIRIIGAGRTDAGVHALAQVAHFSTETVYDVLRLKRSLNGILPCDIRILSVDVVDASFHAQRSAKGKIYSYHLCLDEVVLPFVKPYVYHLRTPIDISLLQKALQKFVGTHNFTSFTNSATEGACSKNPVRTISSIDLVTKEFDVTITFQGNGFLYKMVRNIVGACLTVAQGKLALDDIDTIFAACDRKKAPKAAPAQGLFLEKVLY